MLGLFFMRFVFVIRQDLDSLVHQQVLDLLEIMQDDKDSNLEIFLLDKAALLASNDLEGINKDLQNSYLEKIKKFFGRANLNVCGLALENINLDQAKVHKDFIISGHMTLLSNVFKADRLVEF